MTLKYLLDTNICIYIAKHSPIHIFNRFEELVIGEACMSMITYGELFYGVYKSQHSKKNMGLLQELISIIPPLPMPTEAGKHYGHIRSTLEKKGTPIGNNDTWIAAHALSLDVTLVTNNTKEFTRISHLKLENWA
ncbi:MAG: type II toxin-antitoxin system VapC family toxin [Chlamydiales bacterium]|nr:type II toxin-antitoxin system VapC family toxin [Chlamydiales bacterium]